jgi:hypothetical protein
MPPDLDATPAKRERKDNNVTADIPNNRHATVTEGMLAGTAILTLASKVPVEHLSVGDRVITRSGARALVALRCMCLPRVQLVCISASTLGIEQPVEDMRVSTLQGIQIRDWRTKVLKGIEQGVTSAKELTDGEFIRLETHFGAWWYSLEFDNAEVIYANGVELPCLAASANALIKAPFHNPTPESAFDQRSCAYSPKYGKPLAVLREDLRQSTPAQRIVHIPHAARRPSLLPPSGPRLARAVL